MGYRRARRVEDAKGVPLGIEELQAGAGGEVDVGEDYAESVHGGRHGYPGTRKGERRVDDVAIKRYEEPHGAEGRECGGTRRVDGGEASLDAADIGCDVHRSTGDGSLGQAASRRGESGSARVLEDGERRHRRRTVGGAPTVPVDLAMPDRLRAIVAVVGIAELSTKRIDAVKDVRGGCPGIPELHGD